MGEAIGPNRQPHDHKEFTCKITTLETTWTRTILHLSLQVARIRQMPHGVKAGTCPRHHARFRR